MFSLENFKIFRYVSSKVLTIYPVLKENYIKCNQFPFMNKNLREPIITLTCLLNKYNRKYNGARNLFTYKRLRNLCVKLLRKSKKDFYKNLNVKRITDTRNFLKTIK